MGREGAPRTVQARPAPAQRTYVWAVDAVARGVLPRTPAPLVRAGAGVRGQGSAGGHTSVSPAFHHAFVGLKLNAPMAVVAPFVREERGE